MKVRHARPAKKPEEHGVVVQERDSCGAVAPHPRAGATAIRKRVVPRRMVEATGDPGYSRVADSLSG